MAGLLDARAQQFDLHAELAGFMAASSSMLAVSASRSLSAPSRAASAFSCHCSSLKMGTASSRERSSTLSLRSRRMTTSRLRATLQRWPGARGPTFGAATLEAASVVGAIVGCDGGAWPMDSADGLRSPSLPTGVEVAT